MKTSLQVIRNQSGFLSIDFLFGLVLSVSYLNQVSSLYLLDPVFQLPDLYSECVITLLNLHSLSHIIISLELRFYLGFHIRLLLLLSYLNSCLKMWLFNRGRRSRLSYESLSFISSSLKN